jgi:hypothetical protein
MPAKLTYYFFIEKATLKHNGKFTYNEFEYINSKSLASVNCSIHGEFKQLCGSHLSGRGCKACRHVKLGMISKHTKQQFVEKAINIHNQKYDYSKFIYVDNKTHGLVKCNNCIHEWKVRPDLHLYDQTGCPNCNRAGVYYSKEFYESRGLENHKMYTYLIEMTSIDEKFIKIGITKNLDISKRFRSTKSGNYDLKVLTIKESNFLGAVKLEQSLLQKYHSNQYNPKIKFKGHTECFHIDAKLKLLSDIVEIQ